MNEDLTRVRDAKNNTAAITDEELDALIASILTEDDAGTQERYSHIPAAPVFEVPVEPAFEDPDRPFISPHPPVVRNFSNDYGNDRAERARKRAEAKERARRKAEAAADERWQIILMGVASTLCLGIMGVMIYWLVAFF